MELIKIIEDLEETIEDSSRIPMTGKMLIDEEIVLDYLDKLRASIPEEIRQAQWITKERERILNDAQSEGEAIINKAKIFASKHASENEIVKKAEEAANEIINNAQAESEQIQQQAKNYALEVLHKLEKSLTKALTTVEEGKETLNSERE
ncbi:MAG: ATPase [Bacillota bacterium]|nr:ATPase [Bacillota bacterium]